MHGISQNQFFVFIRDESIFYKLLIHGTQKIIFISKLCVFNKFQIFKHSIGNIFIT